FKYGRGYVDAKENTQLRYYATGAARLEDFTHAKVRTTIVQPRSSGDAVRSEIIRMRDLVKWSREMREALEASEDPRAKLTPGDHCKWCEVKQTIGCEALQGAVQKAAKVDFEEVDLEADM